MAEVKGLVPEGYMETKRIHIYLCDGKIRLTMRRYGTMRHLCVFLLDIELCHKQNVVRSSLKISDWKMQHEMWKSKCVVTRYSIIIAGGHCASSGALLWCLELENTSSRICSEVWSTHFSLCCIISDKSQPNIIIQLFKFIFLLVPSQFSELKFR